MIAGAESFDPATPIAKKFLKDACPTIYVRSGAYRPNMLFGYKRAALAYPVLSNLIGDFFIYSGQ